MKKVILTMMLIVSVTTLTSRADEHATSSPTNTPQPAEASLCNRDSTIVIPQSEVSLNLMKYMLSRGVSLDKLQTGCFSVDGKQVIVLR